MVAKKKPLVAAAPAAPTYNNDLLKQIDVARAAGTFVYINEADALPFVTATPPLIEVNPTMRDAEGKVAAITSAAGIDYVAKLAATPAAPAPVASTQAATVPAAKPVFALARVAVPAIRRGGNTAGESIYDFDALVTAADPDMTKPNSFFVPATTEKPEPWKSLASTVSAATRKHSTQNGTKMVTRKVKDAAGNVVMENGAEKTEQVAVANWVPSRKFVVRQEADGKAWGFEGVTGAAVYRTL